MQADLLSISQSTVSIKTLTVGTKQLTLSTFRQIPEESILAPDHAMRGTCWGHVNYWWDKFTQGNSTCIHVLWQKSQELRRCRFDLHLINKKYTCENAGNSIIREIRSIDSFLSSEGNLRPHDEYGYLLSHYEIMGKLNPKYEEIHSKFALDNIKKEYEIAKQLAVDLPIKKLQLLENLEKEKERVSLLCDNHERSHAIISAIPQLFIAA